MICQNAVTYLQSRATALLETYFTVSVSLFWITKFLIEQLYKAKGIKL